MEELNPSSFCELGRKEYWNKIYSTELENFEDYGDPGDIWFGENNLQRIVNWLEKNKIDRSLPILDVGCGNGMTLVTIAKAGFENLAGVDYSEEAVQLAEKVAQNQNVEMKLKALDFLTEDLSSSSLCSKEFNVIIDKGTYDAICLDVEHVKEKRAQYLSQIAKVLSPDGYFIIFSCNWTKEELVLQFSDFRLQDEIETPSISFGGKIGQIVTALVMKKIQSTTS